jgi:hypothetical protein
MRVGNTSFFRVMSLDPSTVVNKPQCCNQRERYCGILTLIDRGVFQVPLVNSVSAEVIRMLLYGFLVGWG